MPALSAKPWDVFVVDLQEVIQSRSRYLLGLVLILLQCIVWIVAAVMTQYLYENRDFSSPFVVT
jgi:hypothetical protein